MIGRLRGVLVELDAETAVIEVGGPAGGVGYLVRMGAHALARLPVPGESVTLAIESRTTDEGTTLYGFPSRDTRAAFTTLLAIQGVGPKAALSVLDVLPPAELAAAAAAGDTAAVARAQGVGAKLALRIVTELKGKSLGAGFSLGPSTGPDGTTAVRAATPSVMGEATAALMGLGLAEALARRAVESAAARLAPEPPLAALIKAALQESAR